MADDLSHLQFIAISFADGSVGVMAFHLSPNVPPGTVIPDYDPATGTREATDEAIQHEIDKSSYDHKVVGWRRMDPTEVMGPADRTYRNAWTDTGKTIDHDMTKAKAIHRDILRAERAVSFPDLDVAYMQADETGDAAAKAAVVVQKQALRDVTADPRIDAAVTVDDLKALTLDVLVGN